VASALEFIWMGAKESKCEANKVTMHMTRIHGTYFDRSGWEIHKVCKCHCLWIYTFVHNIKWKQDILKRQATLMVTT